MSTDVAVRETLPPGIITKEKVLEFLKVFTSGDLNEKEQGQFIEIATAYNLNPFKREIYCVPYMSNVKKPDGSWTKERKLSIITGYEVYLKRAERTGLLNGWTVSTRKENGDTIAKITIPSVTIELKKLKLNPNSSQPLKIVSAKILITSPTTPIESARLSQVSSFP